MVTSVDSYIYLVFDIDDTMYDLMAPFKKSHDHLFAGRVNADTTELFKKSRIYSDIILEREKNGEIPSTDSFHERLRMTYQDVGLKITREESALFEAEYRYYQTKIEMFDFMRDTLDYCRREQILLAVLTNGNSNGQRKKAAVLELNKWFEDDRIFVTGEIGWHKPDVRAFRAVEEHTGFAPEDTWYVGDSYESDVEGASRAGWHVIWLNHRRRPCPSAQNLSENELEDGKELLRLIRQKRMEEQGKTRIFEEKEKIKKSC